jgi:regulator of protease activity HflC (stomatin/prohibitin superfamily)
MGAWYHRWKAGARNQGKYNDVERNSAVKQQPGKSASLPISKFANPQGEFVMEIAGLLQMSALVLVAIAIAVFFMAAARANQGRPMKGSWRLIVILGGVAALVWVLGMSVVTIEPLERGVVTSYLTFLNPKGYRETALPAGINWVLPFFEKVNTYSIARQTYTMSSIATEGQVAGDDSIKARTSDGQEIVIDASVIFQVDPNQVIQIHILWQNRYVDDLVRPQSRGIIRDVISQYKVDEVVTGKRDEMALEIHDSLAEKFSANGLTLVDFVLRNVSFSEEYAKSVEQKQIAEQQALQSAYVVEQSRQEANQAIETAHGAAESVKIAAQGDADARLIQANAEAEALKILAEALKSNPDLIQYLYVTKLAPNVQVMYLPSGQQYLLPLPAVPTVSGTTPSTP